MNDAMMKLLVALVWSRPVWEVTGACALGMLLLGVWMTWRRHARLEEIEEDVKNIKLTPEQGWRKVRFVNRAPPVVITLGVLLMIAALAGFAWR